MNILSLTAEQARKYFLKEDSYCNFELPPYFKFETLLNHLSCRFNGKKLESFYKSNAIYRPYLLEGVNYKLFTNKDGKYAWRLLQLIHPAIYVSLGHLITDEKNWQIIGERFKFLRDKSDGIKCEGLPVISAYYKKHNAAQINHWCSEVEQKSLIYGLDFDYLFYVDIVDCYGSIYTHSIAWALHSKRVAKNNRRNKKLLGNQIDSLLQAMSSGQTNGIPQGSVLMDFIAEMVLCYMDFLLATKINKTLTANKDYKIIRYRDDYRIFTNDPQTAELIVKELTGVLNSFGMRINSTKTFGSRDVINSSIKPDKIAWMINGRHYIDLSKELYAILEFSHQYPNTGQVKKALTEFYGKLNQINKYYSKDKILMLISVVIDITLRNSNTYPIAAAILSRLIHSLPEKLKDIIIDKIIHKFDKIPNHGMMQIWLQRITIKFPKKYQYSELLCKSASNQIREPVWNSEWLQDQLGRIINEYNIVDSKILASIDNVIKDDEFKIFQHYPY